MALFLSTQPFYLFICSSSGKGVAYAWYRVAKSAEWVNLVNVRETYPAADIVSNFTVFNIKGNDYRLITSIVYVTQRIYIKYVLTHAEYNKDKWKDDPYY
jgi:mRNA interferase HigB